MKRHYVERCNLAFPFSFSFSNISIHDFCCCCCRSMFKMWARTAHTWLWIFCCERWENLNFLLIYSLHCSQQYVLSYVCCGLQQKWIENRFFFFNFWASRRRVFFFFFYFSNCHLKFQIRFQPIWPKLKTIASMYNFPEMLNIAHRIDANHSNTEGNDRQT